MYPLDENNNIAFVADVHLKTEDAPGTEKVLNFLEEIKRLNVKHLFILGDFFDFWVNSPFLIKKAYDTVLKKFINLHLFGIKITFIAGNRDFLIADYYRHRDEVEVFEKYLLCALADKQLYLGHGDELCLNDHRYQSYKYFIRLKITRLLISLLPGPLKEKMARRMSQNSRRLVKRKNQGVLEPTPQALQKLFEQGVDIIIHGHTHNGYSQVINAAGKNRQVYGLRNWSEAGSFLFYDATAKEFIPRQV